MNWYNPKIIKTEDAPKTYEECADPKYKGIQAADVRPPFFDMMQEVGGPWSDEFLKKWAAGIKANDPLWTRGNAQAFQVISSGERGMACGIQFHGLFRGDRTDPGDPNAAVRFAKSPSKSADAFLAPRTFATAMYASSLRADPATWAVKQRPTSDGMSANSKARPSRSASKVAQPLATEPMAARCCIVPLVP